MLAPRSPAAVRTPREQRNARRALGSLNANVTPKAEPSIKPLTPMVMTPSLPETEVLATKMPADDALASPVPLKIFGETGILEATRGAAPQPITIFGVEGILAAEPGHPPPSPNVAWPTEWPEDWWDEEDEWWDGATWGEWDGSWNEWNDYDGTGDDE